MNKWVIFMLIFLGQTPARPVSSPSSPIIGLLPIFVIIVIIIVLERLINRLRAKKRQTKIFGFTCPCGRKLPPQAKFCPSCGKN